MLTLLTTTGVRPEAFAICERMIFRQAYDGPVRWIVVDDGETPQPLSPIRQGWERVVIRPRPFWAPGDNTQGRNLKIGLDAAKEAAAPGEDLRVAVIEDDDWYHPAWLRTIEPALDGAELVGEGLARAYNVAYARALTLGNLTHASLRSSAMRGAALETFEDVVARPTRYYDIALWGRHGDKKILRTRLTVGMKGLPGRPGIAGGHDGRLGRPDRGRAQLRQWVGDDDARLYQRFFKNAPEGDMRAMIYIHPRPMTYRTRRLKAGDEFEAADRHVRWLEKSRRARFKDLEEAPPAKPRRRPRKTTAIETPADESRLQIEAAADASAPPKENDTDSSKGPSAAPNAGAAGEDDRNGEAAPKEDLLND